MPRSRRGSRPEPNTDADVRVLEAKLFANGRSQAVRLPAELRFKGSSVYAKPWRNGVVLLPRDDPWRSLLDSLGKFSDDFLSERAQPRQHDRRKRL